MSPSYEGIEPQFDLAAQEAKAHVAHAEAVVLADLKLENAPVNIYDRNAVIEAAIARAAELHRAAETEIPESEAIKQEPEIAGEPAVAPPDPDAPEPPPPTQADLPGGSGE